MKNMKLSAKLYLLLFSFVAGFMIFGLVAKSTLNTLSINGPMYKEIVCNKDLLADILPPPLYILESYLVVKQACDATKSDLKSYKDQYAKLKKDYNERRDYWKKELNDGIIGTSAVAIEQQATVMLEIATNITEAAHGMQEVNQNVAQTSGVAEMIARDISETNQAVGEILSGSAQVLESAEDLSRLAIELEQMTGCFKISADS